MTTVPLRDATGPDAGGKAGTLARLAAAASPVPDGFVIPTGEGERHAGGDDRPITPPDAALADAIRAALADLLGDPESGWVAVRSSATDEDDASSSAAGRYATFLARRGPADVCAAVRDCWASLHGDRARADHDGRTGGAGMAVLVQRLVDADVSGVLFAGEEIRIEACRGLGEPLVSGQLTPDHWVVGGSRIVERRHGSQAHRVDRVGDRLVAEAVDPADRNLPALTDAQVLDLAAHGRRIAELLGRPVDVEWALSGGKVRILQARPITAALPRSAPAPSAVGLHGTGASPGSVSGPARLVAGPADFARVRPGDVLVCRGTDPAWTPLFRLAGGVVTEQGGALSHAAIVAREVGIPAVLAVPDATRKLADGQAITVDGDRGLVR